MKYAVNVEPSITGGQRQDTNSGKLTTICVREIRVNSLLILNTFQQRALEEAALKIETEANNDGICKETYALESKAEEKCHLEL